MRLRSPTEKRSEHRTYEWCKGIDCHGTTILVSIMNQHLCANLHGSFTAVIQITHTASRDTQKCRAEEACDKAEAVVIATEWAEFRRVDWAKIYSKMSKPAFVFDGRLIVDAEQLRKIGFKVTSIGRGESLA